VTDLDFGCEGCGRLDPLLETADGRALCLKCVEADPNLAGVDPDAIEMLRKLTHLAAHKPSEAN